MPRKYICTVILPDDYIENNQDDPSKDADLLVNGKMSFDDLLGNAQYDETIVVRYAVIDIPDVPERQ